VALAMQNMALAAVQLGLGTCFIGAFQPPEVGKILKVPNDHEVVALLTVGKPNESGKAKERKPLNSICYQDTYGQALLK
ncbi:nitroreductase family protein, partial [bacterium]|nr:nitroreductase family protein [bacterium]